MVDSARFIPVAWGAARPRVGSPAALEHHPGAKVKLTKRTIEALTYARKSGGQYAWDDALPGFGVRVYPSGRKSFVVAYRAGERQRFFTLGRFGPMTLQQAHAKALEVLAATGRGGDPGGDRIAHRRAPNLDDLAERYLRDHARPRKKPSGVEADAFCWRKYVLPRIGKRKVADITRADVAGLHAEMAATPYQANRTLAVSTILEKWSKLVIEK